MKDFLKLFGLAVLGILAIALLAFVANVAGFASLSFFKPKVEQLRYDTFKQSQTYNDGMVRDLQNLRLQYMQANAEQQASLKAIVLHRFAAYDTSRLPPDLQAFYNSVNR